MNDSSRLRALLEPARRVLVFTGAGLSTASGIPDFRGPQGLWTKRPPVYFDEFLASESRRLDYWEYKSEQQAVLAAARPNAAHLALVELERTGRLLGLVTQNIDGLHHAAGSDPRLVVELHGSNREVECVSCGLRSPPGPALERFAAAGACPTCACGGWLKFATVSFGQALDPAVLERAADMARRSDLVVSLGSTLSVQPAAGVPLLAARRGVPYAIVNRGPTDHDRVATLRLEADVSEVVPQAVQGLSNVA